MGLEMEVESFPVKNAGICEAVTPVSQGAPHLSPTLVQRLV